MSRISIRPHTGTARRLRRRWLLTSVALWPLLLVPSTSFSEPLYVDSLLSAEGLSASGGGLSPYGAPVRLPTQISASEVAKVAAAMARAKEADPFADEDFLEFQSLPEGVKGVTPSAEDAKKAPPPSLPGAVKPSAEKAPAETKSPNNTASPAKPVPVVMPDTPAAPDAPPSSPAKPPQPKAVSLTPPPESKPEKATPAKPAPVAVIPKRSTAPLDAKSLPASAASIKAPPAPVQEVKARPIAPPEPEAKRPPIPAAPEVTAPVAVAAPTPSEPSASQATNLQPKSPVPTVAAVRPAPAPKADEGGFFSFLPSPKKMLDGLLGSKETPAAAPAPLAEAPAAPVLPPVVAVEKAPPAPPKTNEPAIELSDAELDKAFAPDDVDALIEHPDGGLELPDAAPLPVKPSAVAPSPAPVAEKAETPALPSSIATPASAVPEAPKPAPSLTPPPTKERAGEPVKALAKEAGKPAPQALPAAPAESSTTPKPVVAAKTAVTPPVAASAPDSAKPPVGTQAASPAPAEAVVKADPAPATQSAPPKDKAVAALEKDLAQDDSPFGGEAPATPVKPAPTAPEAAKAAALAAPPEPGAPRVLTIQDNRIQAPAKPTAPVTVEPIPAAPAAAQTSPAPAAPAAPPPAAPPAVAAAQNEPPLPGEPLDLSAFPKPVAVPVQAEAAKPKPVVAKRPVPARKRKAAPAKPMISPHWKPVAPQERTGVLAALPRLPDQLSSLPPAQPAGEPVRIDRTKDQVTALSDSAYSDRESVGLSVSRNIAGREDMKLVLEQAYHALTLGQVESAVALYKQVLASDPNNKLGLFGLATTYQKAGQNADARDVYVQIFQLYPDYEEAFNNYLVLVSQEQPVEALNELHRLADRNPHYAPLQAQLGMLYMQQNQLPEAIDHLTQAVRLVPDHLLYRYNLAIAMDKHGATSEAVELYEQLLKAGREQGDSAGYSTRSIQERLSFLRSK